MKPADHPDFFKLPPPNGRSRESSIRLDAQGRFWHEGRPVEHAGMTQAFASWISRHPDNGRFVLSNGYDWTYFEVEDVPFFVQTIRVAGERCPTLVLSDGTEEPLDPTTLSVGRSDAVYARVKNGQHEARFTRAAQLELEPLLGEDESGIYVQVGGLRHRLSPRPGESRRSPQGER